MAAWGNARHSQLLQHCCPLRSGFLYTLCRNSGNAICHITWSCKCYKTTKWRLKESRQQNMSRMRNIWDIAQNMKLLEDMPPDFRSLPCYSITLQIYGEVLKHSTSVEARWPQQDQAPSHSLWVSDLGQWKKPWLYCLDARAVACSEGLLCTPAKWGV